MNLKRYSQLFEADIKDNKGIPKDYIEGVEREGRGRFGYTGPNRDEFGEMMNALDNIMRIQQGHQEELTEIGKDIIMNQYGSILDFAKLDIKIVNPDDKEKAEMVQKMLNDDDNEDEDDDSSETEIDLPQPEVDQNEVDKRKILNNLMQGESQNVHSMMHFAKDKIDAIDENLLQYYTRLLEINRKFDWLDEANLEEMMRQNPEMANAEEIEWNGEEEPTIKVRALDLPMLIHETVKGIYELIMANAIPDNEYLAKRIMAETDTLTDEKQDIKFGPFIASDIRDYIVGYLERKHPDSKDIPNIKEFVIGKLIGLDAEKFIQLIYAILDDDKDTSDVDIKDIVEQAISDAGEYEEHETPDEDTVEVGNGEPDEMLKPKERSYADMSKRELDDILNHALDNDDFETIKKIQQYL